MALDITVKISQAAVAGTKGFGIPLILVSKAAEEVPYTECDRLSEVAKLLDGEDTDAYKAAELIWKQNNAPDIIAVCASTNDAVTAISEVANRGWRQLIVVFGEGDEKKAKDVAESVEGSTEIMYFTTVKTTEELDDIKDKENTVALYYPSVDYAVAGVVGESAGRNAGSFTYKNLIISGLEPLDLSDTEIAELHEKGGITIVKKAGDIVTSEGKTTGGEYIDVIDSKHWIIQQIGYNTQRKLNVEAKVPYTDTGISSLATITANVLKTAFDNGMIATGEDGVTPLYSVDFKGRSAMSAEDRRNRVYTGGNFTFTLAGAIHTAEITGELVI